MKPMTYHKVYTVLRKITLRYLNKYGLTLNFNMIALESPSQIAHSVSYLRQNSLCSSLGFCVRDYLTCPLYLEHLVSYLVQIFCCSSLGFVLEISDFPPLLSVFL